MQTFHTSRTNVENPLETTLHPTSRASPVLPSPPCTLQKASPYPSAHGFAPHKSQGKKSRHRIHRKKAMPCKPGRISFFCISVVSPTHFFWEVLPFFLSLATNLPGKAGPSSCSLQVFVTRAKAGTAKLKTQICSAVGFSRAATHPRSKGMHPRSLGASNEEQGKASEELRCFKRGVRECILGARERIRGA